MPSSRQLPPSPIILLSNNHIFKNNDYISIFSHHNSSEFKSYRNNLQHLQSERCLSGLTLFGRSQSLEIQKFFSFIRSGILGCGLENCRDPFGHLPGEEDVESSLQSSQDVLLEAGKTRASKQNRPLLPDELTIPLLHFLVFINLHFTRAESGSIEAISAPLPLWLFWTPWDQLGQQQQMCWRLGRHWPVHTVRPESCLWDKSGVICSCVPQTSCSPSSSSKIKAKFIEMGRWWGKAVFSKLLLSYWALCCPLHIQQ